MQSSYWYRAKLPKSHTMLGFSDIIAYSKFDNKKCVKTLKHRGNTVSNIAIIDR